MWKGLLARWLLTFYFLSHGVYAVSDENNSIAFDIRETQVEISLLKFANQAKLSFFVSYDLLSGIKTSPLVGNYSLTTAAQILFSKTNLVATFDQNGNLNIVARADNRLTTVSNNPSSLDTESASDSPEIITITGLEKGLKRNLLIKLLSTAVSEVVDGEQLRTQASQNVAENLQRSAGVSISRNFGEGTDVSVRGFGPQYNITTINGRTIATSQPNRDFDFRLLPADFVSLISVNKAATADSTAGSIGTNIDVQTAKPFDSVGFHSFATMALNRNELSSDNSDYHYSGLVSNTFKQDRFGIMLGVLNEITHNRFDHYSTQRLALSNTLPENLQWPVLDQSGNVLEVDHIRRPLRFMYDVQNSQQKRTSFNVVAQFTNLESAVHTFDFIYAQYARNSFSSGVQLPGQSPNYQNVVLDQNNSIYKATIFDNNIGAVFEEQVEDIDIFAIGYNGQFNFDSWLIAIDLSHSDAGAFSSLNALVPHYTLDTARRLVDLDFSKGDILSSNSSIPTTDASLIKAHWNGKLDSKLSDKVEEVKLDFENLYDEGILETLSFGVKNFSPEKHSQQFKWNDDYQCAPCGGIVDLPDELFDVVEYPDFLHGATGDIPRAWLTLNNINAYNQTIQNILTSGGILAEGDVWNETVFDPSASYVNTEQHSALYFALGFEGEMSSLLWNFDVKNKASGLIQKLTESIWIPTLVPTSCG
ncbi:MAG: iron complex outermembrane receptor protein [Paraglaciecola sp.]|jgi:iron complex outermembrane receptor protein